MQGDGTGVAPTLELEQSDAANKKEKRVDAPNQLTGLRRKDVREEHGRNLAKDERPGNGAECTRNDHEPSKKSYWRGAFLNVGSRFDNRIWAS